METFIKLYDWTIETGLDIYERVVLSLITQLTEKGGMGFWAGYKHMADRTGIPKSKCKEIVARLNSIGAITISQGTIARKTRIIIKSNPDFAALYEDD